MKFNFRGQLEVEESMLVPGCYRVTNTSRFLSQGTILTLDDLSGDDFTPVGNDALNLVDPDRVRRLCEE